jgi:hypothetical protein
MKTSIVLLTLLFIGRIVSSQDTVININSFKSAPHSNVSREDILLKITKEKEYDYWEYRYVYEAKLLNCPFDSINCIPSVVYQYNILRKGDYKQKDDSIQLSKINCKEGLWWLPPAGGELYLVTIKLNKIDSIVSKADLLRFIKPFNSLDKIRLFFDHYIPLKYKRNNDVYELVVYDTELPIRYYENKSGYFDVFAKYYLRVNKDGSYYKKRIGEYHLKAPGAYTTP